MKYTIEGFSQRNAIAMGLKLDDLIFLRWLIDFKNNGVMKKKYISEIDDMGHWVSYKYVIQQLPILFSLPPHLDNEKYPTLPLDEKKALNKKWINACKKKIQRILSGNLSKVLKRDIEKEKTVNDKGQNQINSKVYVYINPLTYKFLTSDSHGLYVDNSEKSVDKSKKAVDNNTGGQKCPVVNRSTGGQKCPSVTSGQKCPVNSSINKLYSSINTSEKTTSDTEQLENHPNVKLVREKTGLKNRGRDFYKTIASWDSNKLTIDIDTYKKKDGYTFMFLKDLYNNVKNSNSVTQETKTIKTRFHNINQTFTKYSPEELEKRLKESQQNKFK